LNDTVIEECLGALLKVERRRVPGVIRHFKKEHCRGDMAGA